MTRIAACVLSTLALAGAAGKSSGFVRRRRTDLFFLQNHPAAVLAVLVNASASPSTPLALCTRKSASESEAMMCSFTAR